MSAVPVVGQSCEFSRNTGSIASPVWDIFTAINDVSIPDLEMGVAELKMRGSGFTYNLGTLVQSFSVDVTHIANLDATTYAALKVDFLARTVRQYAILDGPIATVGTSGLKVPLLLKSFPWDQAQEKVSDHALKFAVGYMEDPAGTLIPPAFFTAV